MRFAEQRVALVDNTCLQDVIYYPRIEKHVKRRLKRKKERKKSRVLLVSNIALRG